MVAIIRVLFLLFLWKDGLASFVKYNPGQQYHYQLSSTVTLVGVHEFNTQAKITFQNINGALSQQEILMTVNEFRFCKKFGDECSGQDEDFSRWFSFSLSPLGEIKDVYHPRGEDEQVLNTKRGFAAMIAAKCGEYEIDRPNHNVYVTNEVGVEGAHNSSYAITRTAEGYTLVKRRHNFTHPVPRAKSSYEKTILLKEKESPVSSVFVQDKFRIELNADKEFDPFNGMRRVRAVGDLEILDGPDITAHSQDRLELIGTSPASQTPLRPTDLIASGIQRNYSQTTIVSDSESVSHALQNIRTNLTCLRDPPSHGSSKTSLCFHSLVVTMETLPDVELVSLADCYFKTQHRHSMNHQGRYTTTSSTSKVKVGQHFKIDMSL